MLRLLAARCWLPGTRALGSARRTNSQGDVLVVAQLAGVTGAKLTSQLIPLCHSLNLRRGQQHMLRLRHLRTLHLTRCCAFDLAPVG